MKKPSSICPEQLRSIANERVNPVRIQGKQMMRSIVTDYVVRSLSSGNPAQPRQNQRKYFPLSVDVQVNGSIQRHQFLLTSILEKYVFLDKSIGKRNDGIEALIANILEFIGKFEDQVSFFKVVMDGSPPKEAVLGEMVAIFIKGKQKEKLEGQYNKSKTKLYNKYKTVLVKHPRDKEHKRTCDLLCEHDSDMNSNRRSHRISRDSIDTGDEEELYKKYIPTPAASKLKQLVDSCNIFNHPGKLQALRREKLVAGYCRDELQYQQSIEKVKASSNKNPLQSALHPGTVEMLEDWINQISISEYLFNRKYGNQKENNHPQKSIHVEQSDDQ